jgi:hypothetical protein
VRGFVAAGAAWWLQTALAFFGNDSLRWYHQDFPALYTAGRMVADGSGDLLYDTAALASAELAAAGHPVGGSGGWRTSTRHSSRCCFRRCRGSGWIGLTRSGRSSALSCSPWTSRCSGTSRAGCGGACVSRWCSRS